MGEYADRFRSRPGGYTRVVKAGRPPEWFYVSGEGHGFYAEKNRQAFYEKLEAFLVKHIGKP